MKCENCYHAEACGNYPNTGLPEKSRQRLLEKGCEHYKDKSLIVELPCRVGDTVYVCYESPKGISETTIARFEIYGKFTTVVFSNGSQFTVWKNDWRVYKKYVFSSREEAERALEESNDEKNNN